MVLTVKKLIEKLTELKSSLIVGYVDPYNKFHPIDESDVYEATGHFDPSQPDRPWQSLITETKPERVVQLNVPQVGVPKQRQLDTTEEDQWREYGYRQCIRDLEEELEGVTPGQRLAALEKFITESRKELDDKYRP